jgi:hypothetical protein
MLTLYVTVVLTSVQPALIWCASSADEAAKEEGRTGVVPVLADG